jgi:diguanylate cyclase (GGDEF)-like protein
MESTHSASATAPAATLDRVSLLERLLPLKPWLSAESSIGIEEGQSRTRLVCSLIGLAGLATIGQFRALPDLVLFIAIAYPLFAIAYTSHVRVHPAPTRARRGSALLIDNIMLSSIAYFGDAFAAYVAFFFLTTVGWGLRFGRHYLLMTSGLQIAGMGYNMLFSDYWRHNQMFGAVVIMAMLANTINVAILLRRIAWGNHRLEEKTEEIARLAWQDQLTKLPNRLYFHERLSQTLASAERTQRRIALILFDIDGFKTVNDTLGHEAGDRLLQEISRCVGSRIRQADTFARLGGDEFVVIMDSLRDEADARLVAETILRTIAEIDLFAAQGLRIGASVGVACGAGRREIPDLLKQADRAMYAAKRAGKGCYRFADESRGGAA